ncbi:MAG: type II secretion system protein [Parcubacteria group bacterium]|nr:type II secretion system protein [Parcubacteria group bacterium]
MHTYKGFTILELLVVLAVIGMLMSVVIVSMSGVKEKGRDATRMQHLQEVQNALNLYYTNHSKFPVFASATTITGDDAFSVVLEGELVISEVPPDPQHPVRTYTYQSNASGSDYTLTFCLETNSIKGYSMGCANTKKP